MGWMARWNAANHSIQPDSINSIQVIIVVGIWIVDDSSLDVPRKAIVCLTPAEISPSVWYRLFQLLWIDRSRNATWDNARSNIESYLNVFNSYAVKSIPPNHGGAWTENIFMPFISKLCDTLSIHGLVRRPLSTLIRVRHMTFSISCYGLRYWCCWPKLFVNWKFKSENEQRGQLKAHNMSNM